MAVLAVCSEILFKSLGSVLIILGCFDGCDFLSNDKFLTPLQRLPNMIATGFYISDESGIL